MTKCNKCGSTLNDNNKFCSECGQKNPTLDERYTNNICAKCGSTLNDNSKFCSECGQKNPKLDESYTNNINKIACNSSENNLQKQDIGVSKLGITSICLASFCLLLCLVDSHDTSSLSVALLAAILGVIFGSISLHSVIKGKKSGKPIAITGFVLAIVGLVISFSCYSVANKESKAIDNNQTIKQEQNKNKETVTKTETNIPSDYKNALKEAESYSKTMHMSKQEIYDQLTSQYGEKFTASEAQYAIDNLP